MCRKADSDADTDSDFLHPKRPFSLGTVREIEMYGRLILKFAAASLALSLTTSCARLSQLAGLDKQGVIVPSARVVRGPVEANIYATGELRPARTAMIVAPPVAGGALQIIHIVNTGARVNAGDVVVEFDPSEQEYNLEQSKSQLEEAEQQRIKMKADQSVRAAQDSLALLKAQSDVRRADFKIKGNELLGEIEAKKNLINLEEARRRLEQLQRDVKSRASSNAADLDVQNVARAKAMLGMKLALQNIDNMTCRAPIAGIVVLGQNLESLMSGSGGVTIYSGMEIPQYREGDQAYPGRLIAQIQDTEQIEILSKVVETDRGNLNSGQPVDVWVNSNPLKAFTGRIKTLAESASTASFASSTLEYLEALSTRSFDATFELNPNGEPLNLGVTARVKIRGTNMKNALSLPRQALFQKEGKPVVYVRRAAGWEARDVQVKYLTESRAILEGIAEGTEVALVNPDLQKGKTAMKAGILASILGGAAQ
jgi:multidrug resistance efflux pump